MPENDNRLVEFSRLNLFGKGIFVAGTAFRFALGLIDTTVDTVSGLISEVEKAFSEGADPNIDEATIIDEDERKSGPKP